MRHVERHTKSDDELRIIVACGVTPFVAAATMFAAALAAAPLLNPSAPASRFDQPAAMAIGVWFLSVIVLVVAVPIALWMSKRGAVSLPRILFLGAALGILPLVFSLAVTFVVAARSSAPIPLPMTATSPILMTGFGIVVGVCSALTFWAIALRGRAARHTPA